MYNITCYFKCGRSVQHMLTNGWSGGRAWVGVNDFYIGWQTQTHLNQRQRRGRAR